MKWRNWRNTPCPATTAGRNRTGATLPCRTRRLPGSVPSSFLLSDETLVVFLPELLDVPGGFAPEEKCASGNQQQQRRSNDQARLLHKDCSSSGCGSLSIRRDRQTRGVKMPTFTLTRPGVAAKPYSLQNPTASGENGVGTSHEPESRADVPSAPVGEADGGFGFPLALSRSLGRQDTCPTGPHRSGTSGWVQARSNSPLR